MKNIDREGALIAKILVAAIAATFCGGAAAAQSLSINLSMPATSGVASSTQGESQAPNPVSGTEILSPTMGVDFAPYMRSLRTDIQHNWTPLIPPEAQAPLMKKGITAIRFTILPDGKIGSIKLETPSGDVALDRAAWGAITGEGQFPALPTEFHGPQVELRVGFFYNVPVPGAPATAKTPGAAN